MIHHITSHSNAAAEQLARSSSVARLTVGNPATFSQGTAPPNVPPVQEEKIFCPETPGGTKLLFLPSTPRLSVLQVEPIPLLTPAALCLEDIPIQGMWLFPPAHFKIQKIQKTKIYRRHPYP